jgi:TRAP-type C4-dicarboxylate transport system substrate-binding protein
MSKHLALLAYAAFAILVGQPATAAETTLTAIFSIPTNNAINKPFQDLIADINATGKGLVQVRLIGGPEAMPVSEQMGAMQRGVVDLYMGAMGYYEGQVPEVMALYGSNKPAMQQRADGGYALLDEAFRKRVNGKFLAEYGSGYLFYIYLRKEPVRQPDGGVELKDLKIRGSASYKTLYDALGVARVNINVGEIYSALERGVVDGVGFTSTGLTDEGWQRYLKYRISPAFRQGGNGIIMNLTRWNGLAPEQKAFIEKAVIKHEQAAHAYFQDETQKEWERLRAAGMQDIMLTGEGQKRYIRAYLDNNWGPLTQKIGAEQVAEYRKRFYDEPKAP